MNNKRRAWLSVFALLGLVSSGASAYVHYRLVHDPTYTSFCNVSATVNCESVYQSAYGSVAGVPVAIFGTIFFALALLLVWSMPRHPAVATVATGKGGRTKPSAEPVAGAESSTGGYLFVLSTLALAATLYFAYASFFVLKTVCPLCIATYVAVIGLFIISGSMGPARLGTLPGAAARDLRRVARSPLALTVALLFVIGAASAIGLFPRERQQVVEASATPQSAPATLPASDPGRQQFEAWLSAQPRVPLAIPNDGAKVLIVKFNDYQCPPCRQTYNEYAPILERYMKDHPGQVKFVSKDFPLEAECNTGGVHEAGCEAAAAVRMARVKSPERAEELERWIFDNQPAMTPALVRRGVREVGGISDFDAQYPKTLDQVRADVALGRQLGVTSTPTFFINGVKVVGGLRPQFFDVAIAAELAKANGR
jgi:uncharacterized membrane protein/thiol-disulfide isomerase/thioredoxin